MLQITIPGKPLAQKRPKFARRGRFVTTYNPQESEAGMFATHLYSSLPAGFELFKGPVCLTLEFDMPIPQGLKKKCSRGYVPHVKKPDLDNCVKFFKDCAKGVLWVDDSQVVEVYARKQYGEIPCTKVQVYEHKGG